MKSTKRIVLISVMLTLAAVLAGCKKPDTPDVVPTTPPTETVAPTAKPTEKPVVTSTPTTVPTIEPTIEPTAEPTATPEPTEAPHEHSWTSKEEAATCITDGKTWEECECGEVRNENVIAATGHKPEKVVTKEATVEAKGEWKEVCSVCGETIATGEIDKVAPTATPVPTNTPTPKPTSTPTPTPSPKPTATPEPTEVPEVQCSHPVWTVSYVDENDAETIYQESCEDCGEVLGTFAIPKAAATPTPKPTATPVPTKKPEPTKAPAPTASDVVKDYIDERGNHTIQYADGTEIIEWKEYKGTLPKGAEVVFDKSTFKTVYSTRNDGSVVEDSQIICNELLFYFERELSKTKEKLSYYMYYYYDWETDEYTCRLVNSDGSYNKHSDLIIEGFHSGTSMQGKEVWEGNKKVGHEVTFIDFQSGYDDPRIIYAEDFLYHKNGEIRLYEY